MRRVLLTPGSAAVSAAAVMNVPSLVYTYTAAKSVVREALAVILVLATSSLAAAHIPFETGVGAGAKAGVPGTAAALTANIKTL